MLKLFNKKEKFAVIEEAEANRLVEYAECLKPSFMQKVRRVLCDQKKVKK